MPGFNGTGPMGQGPQTGWGTGTCRSDNQEESNDRFGAGMVGRGRGAGRCGGRGRGGGRCRGGMGAGFGRGQMRGAEAVPQERKGPAETQAAEEE